MQMTEKVKNLRAEMVEYISSRQFDLVECAYLCQISVATVHAAKNKNVKIELLASIYDYVKEKEKENGKN